MNNDLSILLTGFSVFAILILLVAYLFYLPDMRKSRGGKVACAFLLGSLALLQIAHYGYFSRNIDLLSYRAYGMLLTSIPALFFFFARVILIPEVEYKKWDALHGVAPLLGCILPVSILPPLAFTFGTAYTFWFARLVFRLRTHSERFKFEMFFFGLFALMAMTALILGLLLPYLDHRIYYTTYSNAVSIAMLLIVAALIFFPALLSDLLLITELAYAKSKLSGIDTETKVQELERLMQYEKHFQNENLSLSNLSEHLDLTSHQLSELINTHYGFGFPRFVREHRVREAKKLLLAETKASILSISMMTGFKSQSNFYTAFKEIAGMSPGHYRKQYKK